MDDSGGLSNLSTQIIALLQLVEHYEYRRKPQSVTFWRDFSRTLGYLQGMSRHGRTAVENRLLAVDARPGFAGFPRLARELAEHTGGHVFTDKAIPPSLW